MHVETHAHRVNTHRRQAQRYTHTSTPRNGRTKRIPFAHLLAFPQASSKNKVNVSRPLRVEETLTSGFASKTVLENSSGSNLIWLAEASFNTEKKIEM